MCDHVGLKIEPSSHYSLLHVLFFLYALSVIVSYLHLYQSMSPYFPQRHIKPEQTQATYHPKAYHLHQPSHSYSELHRRRSHRNPLEPPWLELCIHVSEAKKKTIRVYEPPYLSKVLPLIVSNLNGKRKYIVEIGSYQTITRIAYIQGI